MIKPQMISSSLPCTTKDIQSFVLRKPKYMRAVQQFNEDELLPPHLLFKFFKTAKACKQIKAFNLKWNYIPKIHARADIVKTIFKRHCQTIEKFDASVQNSELSRHSKGLFQPLKNVLTASINTTKSARKFLSLKKVNNLKIDLRSQSIDYPQLYLTLFQLQSLKTLHITCLPESLDQILMVFDTLTSTKKEHIEFEISVGGQQGNFNRLGLQRMISEKITEMSFQFIHPTEVLSNLFVKQPFVFDCLKVLKLDFSDVNIESTTYFRYLENFSRLEKLTITLNQCQDPEVASSALTNLRLPNSLQTLELTFPLHITSALTHTKSNLNKSGTYRKGFPWRNVNIFEEEPAFKNLFQTFENAKNLKTISFDFYMLENFDPHYTNLIISILSRITHISALEIQLKDVAGRKRKTQNTAYFDLAPFFQVCSNMPSVQQIDILMPNLLFKDAAFTPSTQCLKSLTIGVNEDEEDHPIQFTNISKDVDKLLKTLVRYSPNLITLSLDFAETVTQEVLAKRFTMIRKFKMLEALGVRFFVGKCNPDAARSIGQALKSLERLNMLLLKFFETDKGMYGIENYIKYHKSIRNILIQFSESTWMDNECLLDPLNCHIKGSSMKIEEEN